MIRRAALAVIRRLRTKLRGRAPDAEPAGTAEIRDPKTGELLALTRPMTPAEIRETRARTVLSTTDRPRGWLDRRGEEQHGRPVSSANLREDARGWLDSKRPRS